jgi:hypothetical protein
LPVSDELVNLAPERVWMMAAMEERDIVPSPQKI